MENFYCYSWIAFILLPSCFCDVHLKVIFQPPMATLECTITYPKETASVIMMCPNEMMCFQNCKRLCDPSSCSSNNITCSNIEIGSTKRFKYVFNTSIPSNQGEWTCHYGTEKSSTAIFFKEKNPENVKREVKIVKITTSKPMPLTTSPLKDKNDKQPRKLPKTRRPERIVTDKNQPGSIFAQVNPVYVIILLAVFSVSLFINIVFLVRDVLSNISRRFYQVGEKKYSCLLTACIKMFCMENQFKIKIPYRTGEFSNEINPLISRQNSNNLYECSPYTHHYPLFLENFAYLGTPGLHKSQLHNNYMRSLSYPAKSNESKLFPINPIKLNNDEGQKEVTDSSKMNERSNPMIYDDVADPSLHYGQLEGALYYGSLARPNNFNRLNGIPRKYPLTTMSMNNINSNSILLNESIDGTVDDSNDNELLLKNAINSRVELSKEMISQADNLLRQADNLLNKKDSSTDA